MSVALLQQQAGPRTKPKPTGYVLGMDVSNFQGDLYDELAAYPDMRHVVVRIGLSVEPAELNVIARRQVAQALASGRTVGFYFWGYRSVPAARSTLEAVNFMRSVGCSTPVLWLDCETYREGTPAYDAGPDAAWIRNARSMADSLRQRLGLYTSRWWVVGHFPGGPAGMNEFADMPLWDAYYDGDPDMDWPPEYRYGLWEKPDAWQYTGAPIDLDVFSAWVTR